jgi:RNA polymerase sigma factor (sigma-70 family)
MELSSSDEGSTARRTALALEKDRLAQLFMHIVLPYLPDGLALARWLAGNQPDAEDIVQESCVRALKAIDSFVGGSQRAWFLAIVRNTAFSWLRKHRSKALMMIGDLGDIDEVAGAQTSGQADSPATPESELIRRADAKGVAAALEALPLPFREVVVMRDINELTYKEIAQVLNLPIGTVMSRLARGRQRLAMLLERFSE